MPMLWPWPLTPRAQKFLLAMGATSSLIATRVRKRRLPVHSSNLPSIHLAEKTCSRHSKTLRKASKLQAMPDMGFHWSAKAWVHTTDSTQRLAATLTLAGRRQFHEEWANLLEPARLERKSLGYFATLSASLASLESALSAGKTAHLASQIMALTAGRATCWQNVRLAWQANLATCASKPRMEEALGLPSLVSLKRRTRLACATSPVMALAKALQVPVLSALASAQRGQRNVERSVLLPAIT